MGNKLPKRAVLIVNAASRSGADAFGAARAKLTAAGFRVQTLSPGVSLTFSDRPDIIAENVAAIARL